MQLTFQGHVTHAVMYYERSALGGCFNLAGKPGRIVAVTGKMSTCLLKDEGQLILILTEATQLTQGQAEVFKESHAWSWVYGQKKRISVRVEISRPG